MITMVEIRKSLFQKAAMERMRMQEHVNPIRPCLYCSSLTDSKTFLCSTTCHNEWAAANEAANIDERRAS